MTLWRIDCWSVNCQPIHTNNDAEGWHNHLNSLCHDNGLNLYRLVNFLLIESKIEFQLELLGQKKIN